MTQQKRPPLNDPKAMRALAHGARLAILNRLGIGGPATATEVAEDAGITPSAASYHLRMLAKYGFVEDAPARGDGRERLWRETPGGMNVTPEPDDPPEVSMAKDLLIKTVYEVANEELLRAMDQVTRQPPEWREATTWTRALLLMNAAEMQRLQEQVTELIEPYVASVRDRAEVPADARMGRAVFMIYPIPERRPPGLPTEDHDRD